MSKKLIIASTAGLVLCAGFLGLAVAIGGDDIFHDTRSFNEVKPLIDLATRKTWRWSGGDTLALDAPMNIRYRPSDPPGVSVTGPEDLLKHVRVGDGRIASDTEVSGKKFDAVLSGVAIRKFVVNGGENLDLGQIDQPGLDLYINGTGMVSGRGKVERLNLTIAGPGKAELGALSVAGDAKISILGSGDAALSPHGRVKLFIAGSGSLRLLTKPAELRQTIVGSGEVNQLSAEAAQTALKALNVSRIAADAASSAIEATLGNGNLGQITADAVRNGIENAQIEQHVREGVARGLAQANLQDVKSGAVFVPGSNDVNFGHIEQKSLTITIANSGSAIAEGKVDDLSISVRGSGNARLGKLAARSVSVQIMGSGSVTVAPSEELNVTIMGSGNVHLLTRPASVQRQIMGSGRIIEEH